MLRIENKLEKIVEKFLEKNDLAHVSDCIGTKEKYRKIDLENLFQNESNIIYIDEAKKSLISFFEELNTNPQNVAEEISIFDLKKILNVENNRYQTEINSKKDILFLLLKVAFVLAFKNRLNNRLETSIKQIETFDDLEKIEKYNYFRGQSNFDWHLTSSLIRGFNRNIFLDDNFYYHLLTESHLEEKFNRLVAPKGLKKYNKYAFIQHACSYSPLIDFTSSSVIATSFALSNCVDFNDFYNKDAAIICMKFNELSCANVIEVKKDARNFLADDFKMKVVCDDFILLGKEYAFKKADGSFAKLTINTIDELLNFLTPKYKILNIPTNDRMIYQKGIFICFYDCLCTKNRIFYELCPKLDLTKVRICSKNKRDILDSIYKKKRCYDPEHLLDPYLFFKE